MPGLDVVGFIEDEEVILLREEGREDGLTTDKVVTDDGEVGLFRRRYATA